MGLGDWFPSHSDVTTTEMTALDAPVGIPGADHPPSSLEGAPTSARLTIFAAMWATAIFVHTWEQIPLVFELRPAALAAWAVLVAVAYVLAGPSQPKRLVVLAMAQVTEWSLTMPLLPDHWMLAAAVNLVILASALRVRRRTGALSAGDLVRAALPWIAAVTLAAYSFAALSKHNTSFVDPAVSCVTVLGGYARQVFTFLPGPGQWTTAHVMVPLLVESSVPLLLIVRRTRVFGLVLALAFHVALSLTPAVNVFDFTATLLALFFLFSPRGAPAEMAVVVRRRAQQLPEVARIARMLARVAPLCLVPVAAATSLAKEGVGPWRYVLYDTYGIAVVVLVGIAAVRTRSSGFVPLRPQGASPLAIAVVALVVLNGLTPYLGAKSVTSFAMFSNLRTEDGRSNHYLVPEVAVFDNLDTVVVRNASHPILSEAASADSELRYPMLGLRVIAANDPDMSLTIERNGAVERIERAGDHAELGDATGWWARHVFISRFANPGDRQGCRN